MTNEVQALKLVIDPVHVLKSMQLKVKLTKMASDPFVLLCYSVCASSMVADNISVTCS